MKFHSPNCFSIVWGQGNAQLMPHVRPDRPSADYLCDVASALRMRTVMQFAATWLYAVWHTPGETECTFCEFSGLLKENRYSMLALPKVCVVCSYDRRTQYTNPNRTSKRTWLEILRHFFWLGCLGRFREPRSWKGHWWRALCCGSVLWTSRKHGKIFRW